MSNNKSTPRTRGKASGSSVVIETSPSSTGTRSSTSRQDSSISYAQASTASASNQVPNPVTGKKKVPKDKVRDPDQATESSSTCGSCASTVLPGYPMIQCDRCELWFCLKCADMPKGVFDTLASFQDLMWCCPQCKSKALSAVKADWDIESRCNQYFAQVTHRIDAIEASIQQKADRRDILPLVKSSVEEVLNREKRKNNVVVFNMEEAKISSNLKEERVQADLNSFLEVCNNICVRAVSPNDLQSVIRLGKKVDDKTRPLLVEFVNHDMKHEVMKNLPKLAEVSDENLKRVRVKHDMSKSEREEAKRLYEQAKEQESKAKQDGGNFIYRVRGPPWAMKIVKFPQKN